MDPVRGAPNLVASTGNVYSRSFEESRLREDKLRNVQHGVPGGAVEHGLGEGSNYFKSAQWYVVPAPITEYTNT